MFTPLRALARDPEGKALLVGAVSVVAVGTVAYTLIEGWTPVNALYFSVVTLATVGYGDLHPTTDVGKLFTVGYILTGIGVLAAFASELTKYRRPGERIAEDLRLVDPAALEAEERGKGTRDG